MEFHDPGKFSAKLSCFVADSQLNVEPRHPFQGVLSAQGLRVGSSITPFLVQRRTPGHICSFSSNQARKPGWQCRLTANRPLATCRQTLGRRTIYIFAYRIVYFCFCKEYLFRTRSVIQGHTVVPRNTDSKDLMHWL